MKEKIFLIISNQTGVKLSDLSVETNLLKDISINSFDLMTMVSDLEEEFNIDISEPEIRQIRKISDIIKLIESKQ